MKPKEFFSNIALIIVSILFIILIIASPIFLYRNYKLYIDDKPFCEENCSSPINMSEECGWLRRYNSCHEEDEPDVPFWCYEFRGGRCGIYRSSNYAKLFFVFPGLFTLGGIIFFIVTIIEIIKGMINKKKLKLKNEQNKR